MLNLLRMKTSIFKIFIWSKLSIFFSHCILILCNIQKPSPILRYFNHGTKNEVFVVSSCPVLYRMVNPWLLPTQCQKDSDSCGNQKCHQTLLNVSWYKNCPWLRTTVLYPDCRKIHPCFFFRAYMVLFFPNLYLSSIYTLAIYMMWSVDVIFPNNYPIVPSPFI